jgi:pimeloyl-ACP methyl ester carboxylesterase
VWVSARDILSAGLPAGHAVDLTLDLTVDPTVDPTLDPNVDPNVGSTVHPNVDSPLAHARAAITLEVVRFGHGTSPDAARPRPPVIVLLHEGLGCVAMWKDFPAALAAATGLDVVAYSRQGYGRSSPLPTAAPGAARPLDYLRVGGVRELAALLAALALDDVILVGHSDGASIALGYAAAVSPPSAPPRSPPPSSRPSPPRLRGVVAMAPHTFIEEISLAQIRVARQQYQAGPLAAGLARYHGRNVDGAFWGWNAMWLDPAFTVSELAAELPRLSCPVLALQGRQDEYGSLRQLTLIAEQSGGPVEQVIVEDCRHAPHRDQPAATLAALAAFIRRLR